MCNTPFYMTFELKKILTDSNNYNFVCRAVPDFTRSPNRIMFLSDARRQFLATCHPYFPSAEPEDICQFLQAGTGPDDLPVSRLLAHAQSRGLYSLQVSIV